MKILHVINTVNAGGAELHLLTLCRHLKRLGVELCVAYLKDVPTAGRSLRPDFEREGVRTVDLGADRRLDPRCLVRFARLLRSERPMLVHSHLPRADFVAVVDRLLLPSVRWVTSIHGVYSTHWSGARTMPLFKLAWRFADRVVAISHAVRRWLIEEGRIDPTRVAVIHYGIDVERFRGASPGAQRGDGPDGGAVVG